MPESFSRIAGLFLLRYPKTVNGDDAILTESQRALYDEMTPPRPARAREKAVNGVRNLYRKLPSLSCRSLSVAGFGAVL